MMALPAPPPGAPTRDVYGVPNELVSEHVVLRWGDGANISAANITRLADAFEDAWDAEVDTLGMPPPLGSTSYRLNVYVGDSGSNTPSANGASGYYWYDSQGWPMIVLSLATAQDPVYGKTVAAHELFHALQAATGSYQYGEGEAGAWFFEASAEWAIGEVFPGAPEASVMLGPFALKPHLALGNFDYPDEGLLVEGYQYGAFIFPRYLSEHVLDAEAIRDIWTEAESDDPLDTIDTLLEGDLHRQVARFYAHNVTWDYAEGSRYREVVDLWLGSYPGADDRYAAALGMAQADGSERVVDAPLPRDLGANVIRIARPDCGTLAARLDGDAVGSEGSEAAWEGVLTDGTRHVHLSGGAGNIDLDGARPVSLVVVPSAPGSGLLETFDYRYSLSFEAAALDDPLCAVSGGGGAPSVDLPVGSGGFSTGSTGCGCQANGTVWYPWWAVVLVAWRRR